MVDLEKVRYPSTHRHKFKQIQLYSWTGKLGPGLLINKVILFFFFDIQRTFFHPVGKLRFLHNQTRVCPFWSSRKARMELHSCEALEV